MLTKLKSEILKQLVDGATKEELAWISGYLSGLLGSEKEVENANAKISSNKITITYGTETGNAKKLASDFAARARKSGLNPKLVSLDQYKLNDIGKEEYFFTVISTQGDGEPAAGAKKFYDHIHNNGFKVNGLKYAVLALGDTSYPLFCKAGEDVDEQLNKLGGVRFLPLQKCDTDFEEEADTWFTRIIEGLSNNSSSETKPTFLKVKKTSGKKLYEGTVVSNINLNDRGSNKQTHHLEIASDDLDYLPGDSLGIIPENPSQVVDSILSFLNLDKGRKFNYKSDEISYEEVLKKKLNIVYLSKRVLEKYSEIIGNQIPETKIGLLDLIRIYPLYDNNKFEEVLSILEPITPRLYSIASSPEAHSGEIHLTVARDVFCINGETKYGLCSDYFSQLNPSDKFNFYIHKNSQFRLPEDDRDIIMVGPGTGVAPFRSFVSHRETTGAIGKNWLFFGDQHFVTDFLYQSEWQNWLDAGVLHKLDVAFSRDQSEKIYVQHKMMKQGATLFEWIENGAFLYICGAKEPMSVDVENTLLSIIEKQGNYNSVQAAAYLEKLKEEGRYLKDVY